VKQHLLHGVLHQIVAVGTGFTHELVPSLCKPIHGNKYNEFFVFLQELNHLLFDLTAKYVYTSNSMEETQDQIENNLKEFVTILQQLPPMDMYYLIRQVITDKEFVDISKRWDIAKMLQKGTTQRKIASEMGVSLCKITRISRELKRPHSAIRKAVEMQNELNSH
jgi:TrpR family transcriptional regulator, trp operon repressor